MILEVAALTMLNNNGAIQQTWFARAGQGFMGWVWGTSQKISDYFSLADQNEALARENQELYLRLVGQEKDAIQDSLLALVPTKDTIDGFYYIPSKIRKLFDVSEDTVMDWDLNSDNVITITFKSKKSSIHDLVGLGKSKETTNAVELKRGLYK